MSSICKTIDLNKVSETIGRVVESERESYGIKRYGHKLSQAELGEQVGTILGPRKGKTINDNLSVDSKTIYNWESGVSIPDLKTILALCRVFDCDIEYLLGSKHRTRDIADAEIVTGLSSSAVQELMATDNSQVKGILSQLIDLGFLNLLKAVNREIAWSKKVEKKLADLSSFSEEWLRRIISKSSNTTFADSNDLVDVFFDSAISSIKRFSKANLKQLNEGFPDYKDELITSYGGPGGEDSQLFSWVDLHHNESNEFFLYATRNNLSFDDRYSYYLNHGKDPEDVLISELMPRVYYYGFDYFEYEAGKTRRALELQHMFLEMVSKIIEGGK